MIVCLDSGRDARPDPRIVKWVFLGLGSLVFASGVLVLPLPLPLGLPLMALGVALVYPHSRRVQIRVRHISRRSALVARVMRRIDRAALPGRAQPRDDDRA